MKAIIWDLDNTIYQTPDGFHDACYKNAVDMAIAKGFAGDVEKALTTAYDSFKQFGYNIAAFFTDHGIDRHILEPDFVKSVADLLSPCSQTRAYIEQFTGPQMVISHSNDAWVDAIMRKLEIDTLIPRDKRLVMEDIGHQGKILSPEPFVLAAKMLGHPPQDIIVFEDVADNLIHAKQLGMTTVLVSNGKDHAPHDAVDHIVTRPYDFQLIAAELL